MGRGCRVPIAILLWALTGATAATALESFERTIELERRLGRGVALGIENLIGSIEVRGGTEPGRVRIVARVVAEHKDPALARSLAEAVRLDATDGKSAIEVDVAFPVEQYRSFRMPVAGMKGFVSRFTAPVLGRDATAADYAGHAVEIVKDRSAAGLAVHLTVTVPLDARASISQVAGPVAVRTVRGKLQLKTVSGPIEVAQAFGTLDVETRSGPVEVSSFQGESLRVRTETGDVSLVEVRTRELALHSTDGSIRGSNLEADELRVESERGAIRLDGIEPTRAELRTGSGEIDLSTHLRHARQARIHSDSGDVTLRVGELTYFDLLAETKTGEIKTLGLALDLVERTDRTVRLRRSTGGPDLEIAAPQGSLTVRPSGASRLDLMLQRSGG